MSRELSSSTEQYLASVIAGGLFPSEQAALEAAVEALREKTESIPYAPEEHMARLEKAIEEADAGHCSEMSEGDWEQLRDLAREVAAKNASLR